MAFLTAIFGHLTSLRKKWKSFLSVQSYLQSEMFLSNSVDMMKNLLQQLSTMEWLSDDFINEKSLFPLLDHKLLFNHFLGHCQESPKLNYTIVQSTEWRYSCHLENSFASIAHWMQSHLALTHNILWNFLRVQLLN